MVIVDLGCSVGWFEVAVRRERPTQIVAFDISFDIVAAARTESSVDYLVATATAVSLAAHCADVVTMFDVIDRSQGSVLVPRPPPSHDRRPHESHSFDRTFGCEHWHAGWALERHLFNQPLPRHVDPDRSTETSLAPRER
jgi:methyltransferase family protein